jgi:hypothetical protein
MLSCLSQYPITPLNSSGTDAQFAAVASSNASASSSMHTPKSNIQIPEIRVTTIKFPLPSGNDELIFGF